MEQFFGLDLFDFTAKWSPYFIACCIFVLGLYEWLGRAWITRLQRFLFYSGIVIIYVAFGSPLDLLGHLIFSAHMMSMALAYMVAPPLLILGIPLALWDKLFGWRLWKPLSWMMHPVMTLVVFNVLFSMYHFPALHDKIMTIYWLHTIVYIVLFITALMMWWHVTPPDAKYARLTDLKKMGYIFATGLLLTPACALIIFTGSPMYATYSDPTVWMKALGYCVPGNISLKLSELGVDGPAFFKVLPPLQDQQLGGVFMKLVQEGINAALLYYVFKKWYKREQKE
jgi:putative membrane protein